MESIKRQNWRILHLLVGMVLNSTKLIFFSKSHPKSEDEGMVLGVT